MRFTRWQTWVAALLGILIPLPLVWLLWLTWQKPQQPSPVATFIPMLQPDHRRALLTYQRDCHSDAECDPPLGCISSSISQARYCTDSMCETDAQCPDGFACAPLKTLEGNRFVRACTLIGERKEGERCAVLPSNLQEGCTQGLLCQGRCGRPCQLDNPSSCPEGFFCSEGRQGPASCLPTCEGRMCPEGQQCISQGRRGSICATVHGEDCLQQPCPEGQKCVTLEPFHRPGEAWRECRQPCGGTSDSPCPEGTVCHLYQCIKTCEPEAVSSCEPGFTCTRRHDTEPWRCIPE